MPPSSPQSLVDCNLGFDLSNLEGKTAVVTGGANGIGEAYVQALVRARAFVYFGDINVDDGHRLASELLNTEFVPCDVTNWDDQMRLFQEAASQSPSRRIDYVVANAGISAKDEVFSFESEGPTKPTLKMLDVNLIGSLYTTKIATHYFINQHGQEQSTEQHDTCLVLISSGAGYFDVPRTPQYCASKWAMRGIMHALRRTVYYYSSRVNIIALWYVKTKILPEETFQHVARSGVEFAKMEDASECLLRILSDKSINGKALFIAARKWALRGYIDLDLDEYWDRDLLDEIRKDQIVSAPVEAGLFVE
ncbi:putative short chain dehydrogenase/ reductase [Lophiotrema nucula]|uniref:Putative short chain dehydrogenase/ reductase n=1 Tax=Lophiotrema nucula TaxID=690887 RepID=A0A6A5ZEL8_9PLEO|nr:putative short chain dehydrogenase/ reductase [Lophiotrema nucula]